MDGSKILDDLRTVAEEKKLEINFLAQRIAADNLADEDDISTVIEHHENMAQLIMSASVPSEVGTNAWSSGILMIVKDLEEILACTAKEHTYIHMCFCATVLVAVIVMQGMSLFWIHRYVSQPFVNHLQAAYAAYHRQCFFGNKTFNPETCNSFSPSLKEKLCGSVMRHPFFLYAMCLSWALATLTELRNTWRNLRAAFWMPKLPRYVPGADQVIEERQKPNEAPMFKVYALTLRSRILIWALVGIPQLIIVTVLYFLGLRFLISTTDAGDLILNTMTLIFVQAFPTLLAKATFPHRLLQETENLVLQMPLSEDEKARHKRRGRRGYCRSCILIFVVMGSLFLYLGLHLNAVIPLYNGDLELMCGKVPNYLGNHCEELSTCFPYGR